MNVDGAKSEIKVERSCDPGCSAEDFSENIIENTVVGIVVIDMGRACTDIRMPVYNDGIRAYIGFLVDTVKARGGMTSQGTRRGAVIRCLALRRQVVTMAQQPRGRSRVNRTRNNAWKHARNQRRIATPRARPHLHEGH